MQGTVRIQAGLADHCTIRQEIVINIVTNRSTERHTQIPVLIEEFSCKTHNNISRGFLVEITVTIVNTSVTITVYVHTFNRFTILIIYLLINKEWVSCFTYSICLNQGIVTTADLISRPCIIACITIHQVSNFIMVPSNIIAYIPSKIFSYNRFGINREFHTVILQRTDILC